jgi:retron-type reverse transcriptase
MSIYEYNNITVLRTLKLPIFSDLNEFSQLMGISSKIIYSFATNPARYYHEFSVPKKNGGTRIINAPIRKLKILQKWILREILEKISVSDYSMAFRKGSQYGIKKNAEIHAPQLYALSFDLEDFFPSISSSSVWKLFSNIGYGVKPANLLAALCTINKYLPQGAVCSPYLSNLICSKLDLRLASFSHRRNMEFSRYADDITFSCDDKNILRKNRASLDKIIQSAGYRINTKKTRFLSPYNRKVLTGININNETISVPKTYKKKIRAAIYSSITSRDYSQRSAIIGMISYVNYIEPGYKEYIVKYINQILSKPSIAPETVIAYSNNKFINEVSNADRVTKSPL